MKNNNTWLDIEEAQHGDDWMDKPILDARVIYFPMAKSPNGQFYIESEFTNKMIRKGRVLRFFDKYRKKYRYFTITKRRKYGRLGHVRAWTEEHHARCDNKA